MKVHRRKSDSRIRWIWVLVALLVLTVGCGIHSFAAEEQNQFKVLSQAQSGVSGQEKPATVIRVGYTESGQMIEEKGGQITGYGVAYLNMLSAYTGWEYEYIKVPENCRIEELKNGNIDLLCDVSEEAGVDQLLLSEEISGLHYALLCAKEDDTSIFFDEYSEIDGKRIALNKSRNMEHMIKKFADDHSISYTPVYCSSFSEMKEAVEDGHADLMVASNQRKLSGYKYVAKLGLRNQYFAVSQEHSELMGQIDFADRQVKTKQPFIIASLYERFFGRPSEVLVGMTREEYEFRQSGKPVRIVCDANSFPVAYIDEETGQYRGVYADALALIEKQSGLKFEIVPTTEYKNSWDMLQNGEADMSEGMYLSEGLKQKYGLISSNPYIYANYTMVIRVNKALEDTMKIAMPENYVGIQQYVKDHHPGWEIIPCEDNAECLSMAQDGKVDGTMVNSVFLQTVYNLNNYSELVVFPMHSVDIPISYAFAGPDAQLLCKMINKAIREIPKESFENCTVENAVKVAYEPTTADLIRRTFPYVMLILGGTAAVYLLILWFRERHYRHLAMTDSVTGIWNGRCFREKAGELLSYNSKKEYQMISLDLEHFKYANDDFGEKAADSILQSIAMRLGQLLRDEALYAREIGDKFLILAEADVNPEELLDALGQEIPFDSKGISRHYKPDFKFGVCRITTKDRGCRVSEYIDRATAARVSIKRNPNQSIAYYDRRMAEAVSHVTWIEKMMETALKQREFEVYYQPKYCLESDRIAGAEAVVRWNNPEEGMIYPDSFIPVFERNGFIAQLDFFVYEEVLKTIAKWRAEGRGDLVVSVNVSRAHIGTSDFLPKLLELTAKYQVPHRLLELELTETLLGGKRQDVIDFIRTCKKEGFTISIDDFGSGYSSLNLLKELPVDVLKLDRDFLNETEVSEKSSIIIAQIVEMAGRLNIHTLCEGVETPEQAEFLKKIGCEQAQGYLYSKPVPLEKFEELLQKEQRAVKAYENTVKQYIRKLIHVKGRECDAKIGFSAF